MEEARAARKKGDIAAAIVKIDEAKALAPKEPNVLYEQALIYEVMIPHDARLAREAADTYYEIFKLGEEKSGSLYSIASKKLANGI